MLPGFGTVKALAVAGRQVTAALGSPRYSLVTMGPDSPSTYVTLVKLLLWHRPPLIQRSPWRGLDRRSPDMPCQQRDGHAPE